MANRRTYLWASIGLLVFCVLCVALPSGYFFLTDHLPGAQAPASDAEARFSSLAAGRSADNPQAGAEFSQADTINVFYTVESADDRFRIIKALLIAVAVEGVTPETILDGAPGTGGAGPGVLQFTSGRPWPLGSYRIDATIDDQPAGSIEIKVVGTNTSGAQLQNVFTSTDQNGEQQTDTFPTAGSIFVQFSLANAPADTFVQGVMVAEDASGLESGTKVTETSGRLGDGSYWFEFFNDGPWPVGKYIIYIYLNGQFIQQVEVMVQ